jgi:hypothetical protein
VDRWPAAGLRSGPSTARASSSTGVIPAAASKRPSLSPESSDTTIAIANDAMISAGRRWEQPPQHRALFATRADGADQLDGDATYRDEA